MTNFQKFGIILKMRKVSLKIVWYALLSVLIVSVLGACIQPVSIKAFLGDDKVQDLIKKGGVEVDPGYEHPGENGPDLESSNDDGTTWVPVEKDVPGEPPNSVVVSLGSSVTIRVVNDKDYGEGIEWHYNSRAIESGAILTVDTAIPPFNAIDTYAIAVIGDVHYSTLFYVQVVEP